MVRDVQHTYIRIGCWCNSDAVIPSVFKENSTIDMKLRGRIGNADPDISIGQDSHMFSSCRTGKMNSAGSCKYEVVFGVQEDRVCAVQTGPMKPPACRAIVSDIKSFGSVRVFHLDRESLRCIRFQVEVSIWRWGAKADFSVVKNAKWQSHVGRVSNVCSACVNLP